jgi:hypothetical protein
MKEEFNEAKLPGKTKYSGRRRPTTRKSGFKVHPETSGGEFKTVRVTPCFLKAGSMKEISIELPAHKTGEFVGFGGWFTSDVPIKVEVKGEGVGKVLLKPHLYPNWGKVGSMWICTTAVCEVKILFAALTDAHLATWEFRGGVVEHKHLGSARQVLLGNMYLFSPEALFIVRPAEMRESPLEYRVGEPWTLFLKSCNRCGRYLPINVKDERATLSFSNHCVAAHRRPCSHKGFGLLKNPQTGEELKLEYGFQLECRFCKKFEVNAAHNPKRTAAQMKEDAARRRGFELLLMELYGESAQLRYRHAHGTELTDDIFKKFDGKCFKCDAEFESPSEMHLDHTRPLALLWPLDGTATALCGDCNSAKRDRPPVEFYEPEELEKLSSITGIALEELKNPTPNLEAVELLREKLEWFFAEFLQKPEMLEERDGKVTGELVVKALQKTINKCRGIPAFDLQGEFEKRRETS